MLSRALLFACLAFAVNPGNAARLFSETFASKDGTDPVGWVALGAVDADWTIRGQELSCGGTASATTAPTAAYALISSPKTAQWTNYFVQTDFWIPGSSGGAAVVARCLSEQDYYEGSVVSTGQQRSMQIDRVVQGVRSTLARKESGPDFEIPPIENMSGPQKRHVLRMVVAGDAIELSLNGRLKLRANDASLRIGTAGVAAVTGAVRFDNVIVDDAIETVFRPGPVAPTAPAATAPPVIQAQVVPESPAPPASPATTGKTASSSISESPQKPALRWYETIPEAMAEAARTGKKILIYFHEPDGAYPPPYERGALSDSRIQKTISEGFIPVHIDMRMNRELAEKLRASGPDTFMVYDSTGNPVRKVEKTAGAEQLLAELQRN
jgi:hypothetical protein